MLFFWKTFLLSFSCIGFCALAFEFNWFCCVCVRRLLTLVPGGFDFSSQQMGENVHRYLMTNNAFINRSWVWAIWVHTPARLYTYTLALVQAELTHKWWNIPESIPLVKKHLSHSSVKIKNLRTLFKNSIFLKKISFSRT